MEMDGLFSRVGVLVGEESMRHISDAHVVVVGYGAVGSFATEALVRSGVGHVRIIDADVYEVSNVNRQLGADVGTVGRVKVEIGRERLVRINPDLDVESVEMYVNEDTFGRVTAPFSSDGRMPDVVIDAIDTIDAKIGLLVHCHGLGLVTLSSMGAARKRFPEMIRCGDVSGTEVCPLAREVRKRLRRHGITHGIRCVYSIEHAVDSTHSARGDVGGVVRRPCLGSLVTVTGAFGLRLASEALSILAGWGERGKD